QNFLDPSLNLQSWCVSLYIDVVMEDPPMTFLFRKGRWGSHLAESSEGICSWCYPPYYCAKAEFL
ncbi:hypothetical protein S83_017439, partial [Arachis hypogaea]